MSAQPVIMVSGDDLYRKRKKVQGLLQKLREQNWRLVEIEGSDRASLSNLLTGSSLFRVKTLAIIQDADVVNVDLVLRHVHKPAKDVIILLDVDGSPKKNGSFKKIAEVVPPRSRQEFKLPVFWKQEEDAIELCVQEARERGKILASDLARQMVGIVGTDLGLLSQEVSKLCVLLEVMGTNKVEAKHVSATITSMHEASVQPFIEALGTKQSRKMVRALHRIETTHSADPTIKVIRFTTPSVLKWFSVSLLSERGMGLEAIADELEIKAWTVKKSFLAPAKKWGSRSLSGLVEILAQSERDVFQGVISPWVGFCSRMLGACQNPHDGQ